MKAKRYQEDTLCGMCDKPIVWEDKVPYDKNPKQPHYLSCTFVSERRKRMEKVKWEIKGVN